MAVTHFVIFSVLVAAAAALVAKNSPCNPAPESCSVSEVRITPCKSDKHCDFKHGDNATINFDFTPNFAASNLRTSVWWVKPEGDDLEFSGFGTNNACELTTCPTQVGATQTLNYGLYIAKKLPPGKYTLKWKVWNNENSSQVCCFQTDIRIKKSHKK